MNPQIERELQQALAAAGCGILRRRATPPTPTLGNILNAVSMFSGVSVADLKSSQRTRHYTTPRMVFYCAAGHLTSHSFSAIGRFCGDRDHATVMAGISRVRANPSRFEPLLSKVLAHFEGGKP